MEEFTITTRAKAHKLNNINKDVNKSIEKTKQSQKNRKPSSVKDKLNTSAKQYTKKKSNIEKTFNTSTKKKVRRQKLKYEETQIEDEDITSENKNIHLVKSNESLEEKYDNSISKRKYSKRNISLSVNLENPDKTSKMQQQNKTVRSKNALSNIITPKSTIVKLNLTPHRSTKTPKKSPIPLSSPKTHSSSNSKLSKTPRKLSFMYDENINKSDYSYNKKSRKVKKDNSKNTSMFDESLPTASSMIKNKRSKHNVNLKEIIRKFSKSPKIVLRPSKSKKSKSPKFKLLSSFKKSPLKRSPKTSTPSTTPKSKSPKVRTPIFKNKNLSKIKHRLLNSRLINLMTDLQLRDVLAEPIVLIEKLSFTNIQDRYVTVNKRQSDISINAQDNTETVKTNDSVKLKISSLKLVNVYQNSDVKSMARLTDKLSSNIECNTIQKRNTSSNPLMSSTPKDKKLSSKDTNSPIIFLSDTIFNIKDTKYENQHIMPVMQPLTLTNENTSIKKKSKSLLLDKSNSDVSRTCLSNTTKCNTTYNINEDATMPEEEQEETQNDTYELKQPRTLCLLQMCRKRTATDANLDVQENVEKSFKVHLTNSTPSKSNMNESIGKSGRLQSRISHETNVKRTSVTNSAQKSRTITSFLKTNSIPMNYTSRIAPKNQLTSRSPSLNSISSKLSFNKMQVTPKPTPMIFNEKKSEKKSSVKKMPDFKKMHERMFAKSESLVDAKKRLQDRHLKLTTKNRDPKSVKKVIRPSDTDNGIHNRFGFKLRKVEATHIMLKEQTIFSREQQQHERRMVLKGVRTNRRFELQMKARDINKI